MVRAADRRRYVAGKADGGLLEWNQARLIGIELYTFGVTWKENR